MKLPGRNFFHPDVSPDQSPQLPDLSLNVGHAVILSESEGSRGPLNVGHAQTSPSDGSSIADAETTKMPPLPLESNRDNAIAGAETLKMSSPSLASNRTNAIADV